MKNVAVLEGNNKKRLGVISFIVNGANYNLVVKILNDRFGIQARGGCSCAGAYGHRLLKIDKIVSYKILESIRSGDLSCKPGWIRLSIHPTMTDDEVDFIMDAIETTIINFNNWQKGYRYNCRSGEYALEGTEVKADGRVKQWFDAAKWDLNAQVLFT